LRQRPRIAVDAMGGDGGIAVTVAAATRLAHRADLTLVGDGAAIEGALRQAGSLETVGILHTAERVEPGEPLPVVLKHKPDTSMRRAVEELAADRVDAVVSAGDTAALLALARGLLPRLPGVQRPAICKALSGSTGPFWMLDLGANLDAQAPQLHQFARMGSILVAAMGVRAAPRVALLNIGTEPGKGPRRLHEAATLLRDDPALDYIGYIEGNRLFHGEADVVVADGFTGNIALKSIEGAAWMAGRLVRRWLDGLGPIEQAGLALARNKLAALRRELNPQTYNGASFLGLTGVVLKSHGSADIDGFASAIEQAIREVEEDVPRRLARQFAT
jgi:glycerol-3-phosphate acyltransferase PlsX